jgi:hypothetical protein
MVGPRKSWAISRSSIQPAAILTPVSSRMLGAGLDREYRIGPGQDDGRSDLDVRFPPSAATFYRSAPGHAEPGVFPFLSRPILVNRRKTMGHSEFDPAIAEGRPWNAGRKLGAKRALKPQQVWAIRFWLDRERRLRDRALFDFAIDSKLRGCDVVKVRIGDLVSGGRVRSYGTHSLRRTKASIIYKATGNLRAVQILLGHTKIESTVRYLGVDVEDALALAEGTDV